MPGQMDPSFRKCSSHAGDRDRGRGRALQLNDEKMKERMKDDSSMVKAMT